MKLIYTRFCPECSEVFSTKSNLNKDKGTCPSCTNKNTIPISSFLRGEKRKGDDDKSPMIIAIDFDGTVVDHRYPEIGEDVPHAVECLKKLTEKGHKLILFTMRSNIGLFEAMEWFKKKEIFLWGVQYNPNQAGWSQSNKCYAEIYIDDSAFGCPLIFPSGFARPCVDWKIIERCLIGND